MGDRDLTTFYFDKLDLGIILEPHTFYVLQANTRLLSQFSDIQKEAEFVEQQRLEFLSKHFDPERDDEGDVFEDAYQEGISHWLDLNEMHNTVTLALTAGMFHQFDKQLRDKTARELSTWNAGRNVDETVWDMGFPSLIKLLEWVGIEITSQPFYEKIDACRLVVNVYKHGNGDAHDELIKKYPVYYPSRYKNPRPYSWMKARHDELKVSSTQFNEFAEAITQFWENIPFSCHYSQLEGKNDLLTNMIDAYDGKQKRRKKPQAQ